MSPRTTAGTDGRSAALDPAMRSASSTGSPMRTVARTTVSRRVGVPVAIGLVMLWGSVGGWWMPRGPLSTGQALATMAISLLVGAGAGLLSRSRWAMLGAPVLFVLAYESVRAGAVGPMVDGFHLSTYGLVALAVGRGFHGLLALAPMVLGAAAGAGAARARVSPHRADDDRNAGRIARRAVAGITALLLIGLAVALARPATTDPIVPTDPAATPIAELTAIDVDGRSLGLMIRGHDTTNPLLLFLAGGPGGSERGAMRRHLPELEKHFTVVTWDQRGTGTSYPALDPVQTLTPESVVADTLAVTDYLRARFDQDRIILLGQSWGSLLGVLAARSAPEKYAAFVGTGQMVSPAATDEIFYRDTLEWAASTGRADLHQSLTEIGPPPYSSILHYESALGYEHDINPYDHSANSEGAGGFSENLFVSEYTLVDQVHLLGAFLDTYAALYPQLQEIDFRSSATYFEIPVFFVQGTREASGRSLLFQEWFPAIDAPVKDVTYLPTSGHRPLFEQPAEFVAYLTGTVLPAIESG